MDSFEVYWSEEERELYQRDGMMEWLEGEDEEQSESRRLRCSYGAAVAWVLLQSTAYTHS